MNCSRVQNLLSCYIDRELPGVDMLSIQRHLDGCPECRREYHTLLQVKQLLSEMPVVSPSESLEKHLVQQVLRTPAPGNSKWRFVMPRPLLRPLAVAAAVAAISLGAWYLAVQARSTMEHNMVTASGVSREIDHATLDAYLSGKLRLHRQPSVPAEIPLHPYDNRASIVSVRYYR